MLSAEDGRYLGIWISFWSWEKICFYSSDLSVCFSFICCFLLYPTLFLSIFSLLLDHTLFLLSPLFLTPLALFLFAFSCNPCLPFCNLSLRSQYFPFLIRRESPCLAKSSSSFTAVKVLSYPFPYSMVSQYHLPFPAFQYQSVLHFPSPLLLIPLSVPKYLYLKVFCLTALFTFLL